MNIENLITHNYEKGEMRLIENLMEEKAPSKGMAWSIIGLGILAFIISMIGGFMVSRAVITVPNNPAAAMGAMAGGSSVMFAGGIIGLIAGILQILLLYSWNKAITTNIDNTKIIFQLAHDKIEDPEKKESLNAFLLKVSRLEVSTWAFWAYIILYIIGMFLGMGLKAVLNIAAFIFLAIYLQSVFTVSAELSKAKNTVYTYFLEKPALIPEVKKRNIILVVVLAIITFTIYWLYLLVKLTDEIREFVLTDQSVRRSVIDAVSK